MWLKKLLTAELAENCAEIAEKSKANHGSYLIIEWTGEDTRHPMVSGRLDGVAGVVHFLVSKVSLVSMKAFSQASDAPHPFW